MVISGTIVKKPTKTKVNVYISIFCMSFDCNVVLIIQMGLT